MTHSCCSCLCLVIGHVCKNSQSVVKFLGNKESAACTSSELCVLTPQSGWNNGKAKLSMTLYAWWFL